MITLEQAKQLRRGDMLYSTVSFARTGCPHRAKITSIKTWKTRPNEIVLSWKHGLYTYGTTNQNQLDQWALTEEEARETRGA